MKRKGFTVIELLVVIAIIVIEAAILFPVFARAREKAWQTECLSNMKKLGKALEMYEGAIFPGRDVEVALGKAPGTMLCPNAPKNPEGRSYLWNEHLRGKAFRMVLDQSRTIAALEGSSKVSEFFSSTKEDVTPGRHNEGDNILFLDGHVEWLSSEGLLKMNTYFGSNGKLLPPIILKRVEAEAGEAMYGVEGLPDWVLAIDDDGNSQLVPRE